MPGGLALAYVLGVRRLAVVLLVVLAACPGRRPAPGTDELDRARLRDDADRVEQDLGARGLYYEEPALTAYLDGVAARVAPAGATVRTRVFRTTDMNAFALPNGTINVGVGLLARIDDEAQLAHVLAHEITHLVARHTEIALRRRTGQQVATKLAGILLSPTGFGDPAMAHLYAASVAGYGRTLEDEADRAAVRLIAAAGYPLGTVPRLFDELARVEAAQAGPAYRDHPTAAARAAAMRALVGPASDGDARGATYRAATAGVLRESIRLHLDFGEFRSAVEEAELALAREGDAAALHCYVGDGHRGLVTDRADADVEVQRTGGEPQAAIAARRARELDAAAGAYRRALALDPSIPAAHRGLGLVARMRGDNVEARRELTAYLAGGMPVDRRWVASVLAELPP